MFAIGLVSALVAGHVADVITTMTFLQLGLGTEANGFADAIFKRWDVGFWGFAAGKIAFALAVAWICLTLMGSRKPIVQFAGLFALAGNTAAVWAIVIHNLETMQLMHLVIR
jgi:hypothetical protein